MARAASTTAATATSGAAKVPPKPIIMANAIALTAIPAARPRAASVMPSNTNGTSSKPKKLVHPR